MLQELRKYSKSWIANIFLGALTLSFVAWGIGDIFTGSTSTAVATVGGTSIEMSEFQRQYNNFIRNQSQETGKDITPDQARRMNLGPTMLQQVIAQTALDNVGRKLGLTASDAMVTEQIRGISAFAGVSGTFDHNVFLQKIQSLGYSEQSFIAAIRQDTAREQLISSAQDGFLVPPGYAMALFAYSTELRAANYVMVDDKSLPPIEAPSDTVLQAYVKAHPDRFSTPEYRDVTYAELSPDDVANEVKVTDDQIKSAYEANKDKFDIPEKRDLEQIIFPDETSAKAARAKIEAGTSFAQVAASRGLKTSDIELGDRVAADLDPSEATAVFALPVDGVTQPVKLTFGWVLVRVSKITPAKLTTLDEARPEITKALLQQLETAKLVDIANAYTDANSGGMSLTAAAKKVGMHTGHVVAMDANGLAPDGSKTAAPDDPDFRAAVFKAEVGDEGDPFQTKSGSYYVLVVNGVEPPKLKSLDQVRTQALAGWTAEQRAILVQKKAAELTAQANKDNSLDNVAKAIGAKVQSSPALDRRTNDATFSPQLVAALFNAKPGTSVYGPVGKGDTYVVARVTGITHPLPPVTNPDYMQGVRMISRGVASDITQSLAAAARDKQGVKINSKLLDSVVGGEGS
ncbi:MAG: SurA N-terminal domain-containing protein [Alphaproteobacteria bacterium]|nr:SurA N-terminal domain-containing protein [Alphaproteobacteria bacterium]MDE1985298.1 SurA N-terminal domain-containing protein [Alphaproteobacteria bacterium]MDE2164462.1 SurA N-terminal domain-containing protein [Alphaproteobacteria bacterium]MDE2266953.1 SurA N-terminal domain-containing protein [Alphaproteobacteria bacterium]MDE2498603.1 SurA N-terminal domain-containing protein [Alphaproteobacteria bacterium]